MPLVTLQDEGEVHDGGDEVPVKAIALAIILLLSGIILLATSTMQWLGLIHIQPGAVSTTGLASCICLSMFDMPMLWGLCELCSPHNSLCCRKRGCLHSAFSPLCQVWPLPYCLVYSRQRLMQIHMEGPERQSLSL